MIARRTTLFLVMCLFLVLPLLKAQGQGSEHAAIIVPDSSVEHAGDRGVRAHTNHLILSPQARQGKPGRGGGPKGETPQTIRPVYNLPAPGGSGVIAIVDAYHYPTATNDFNVFSTQFGLPSSSQVNFQVVFASGSQPRGNCGWNQEAALDIEWSHAMAPNAQIVLVEANSNSFSDLFNAVQVATNLVSAAGKGEVSMSWGGSEFSTEATYDGYFSGANVVYFASSGDTGGKNIYPSVSPYVVSAGGTTINRSKTGAFLSETAWSGSGGGPSAYEPRPSFQDGITSIVGTVRGAPDFSFDADPNSGVAVYDSTSCQGLSGWMVFGGTSVAAPSLAGIVNLASTSNNSFKASSPAELNLIYSNLGNASDFRDIVSGGAGSFSAGPGWDFVTGVGSNQGTQGK